MEDGEREDVAVCVHRDREVKRKKEKERETVRGGIIKYFLCV